MGKFEMPLDYIDVAARIVEFRGKHPEGSLQQVAIDFRTFAGHDWIVYTAAAYRTPDDPRPGMGTAWEPVPGKTPYTRDSELQNAETAAWGRAIVAVLAADTKRGIASAEEVRNRRAETPPQPTTPSPTPDGIILKHFAGDMKAAKNAAASDYELDLANPIHRAEFAKRLTEKS